MKTLNTVRYLRQMIREATKLLGKHELRHVHWKDWSVPAKALLTVAYGRDDPQRRKFEKLAEEIDDVKESELSEQDQSLRRKELLPKVVEILKERWISEIGKHVFIVHGRDEAALQTTARFLQGIGLEPVILREQADRGRAIIEKLEDHSDVAYAVVLLTGDDSGSLAKSKEKPRLRARQNVILELGFFLGKLGRENVCVLYQKGIEIPSDYSGVIFVELDGAGAWKTRLAGELEEAGFSVDRKQIR